MQFLTNPNLVAYQLTGVTHENKLQRVAHRVIDLTTCNDGEAAFLHENGCHLVFPTGTGGGGNNNAIANDYIINS